MPEEPVWLPVSQAARRLGVTPQAVRNRIGRGTLEARTEVLGNRTRRLVKLQNTVPGTVPETVPGTVPAPVAHRDDTVIAELRARVAGLEAVVAAQREHVADLRAELAAERARVDRLIQALAERPPPAPSPRRRWWWWRSG